MEEHTKKDLDSLRNSFKRGDSVPKFHYEVRSFSKVVLCPELTDNELEFMVVQGINLNVAKDAHTYCRYVCLSFEEEKNPIWLPFITMGVTDRRPA